MVNKKNIAMCAIISGVAFSAMNINGADSDTGKSTKFVSNIYQNDDVKVSQSVAKNIYNAKVDDSTTFVYKPKKTSKK